LRCTVKFLDELKVRASNGSVISEVSADLSAVLAVRTQYGLVFTPLINLPQATLDSIEQEAAQRSGIVQADFGGMLEVSGAPENLQAAATALLALAETEWVEFVILDPALPCYDIAPVSPNYFLLEDLTVYGQNYHGGNGGVDVLCAWSYCGKGQGVQVTDVEYGFRPYTNPAQPAHEDLCNILTSQSQTDLNANGDLDAVKHGQAVLGMLGARDNAYGWTGLVPSATARFVAVTNTNVGTGIFVAHTQSQPGDVILVEMQMQVLRPLSGYWYYPSEYSRSVWEATWTATSNGRIVVAAAGNGKKVDSPFDPFEGANLDGTAFEFYRDRGDSGAILVGAGTSPRLADPDNARYRMSYSNYGSRVNVQGWGERVTTLGRQADQNDPLQGYNTEFSGTSSAAPMVAGAAAALQSLRVGYGLPRLTPLDMRYLLINTGTPQADDAPGNHIGPLPNVAKAMLQLGIGATDYDSNDVPDGCEELWTPEPLYVCCDANMECAAKMTTFCCAERGGITGYSFDTCTSMTCGLIE